MHGGRTVVERAKQGFSVRCPVMDHFAFIRKRGECLSGAREGKPNGSWRQPGKFHDRARQGRPGLSNASVLPLNGPPRTAARLYPVPEPADDVGASKE
jgi:hypothetical protein